MRFRQFYARFQALTALVLLTLSFPAFGGESSLAPLVDSQTTAIMRVSFKNLDFNALFGTAAKVANKTIDAAIKDPESAKKFKASVPLLLAGYMSGISSLKDAYTQEGFDDAYFIVTPDSAVSPGFFALPIGSLSDEKVEKLRKSLQSLRNFNILLPYCFARHGYLFAPITNPGVAEDRVKEFIRGRFGELHSEPRPDLEQALNEFPQAAVAIVITGNNDSSKQIAEGLRQMETPSSLANGASVSPNSKLLSAKLLEMGEAALYSVAVLDQSDTSLKVRLRFRQGYDPEPALNDIHTLLRNKMQSGSDDGDSEKVQFYENLIEALIPQAEGDRLDWRIDEAYIEANMPTIKELLSIFQQSRQKAPSDAAGQAEAK